MCIQSIAYDSLHTIRCIQKKTGRNAVSNLGGFLPLLRIERTDSLIVISKEEALEIRRRIPSVHIHRTAKQKSQRHRYFVEESYKVLALIQKMRKNED
jgi:hypothetical protein